MPICSACPRYIVVAYIIKHFTWFVISANNFAVYEFADHEWANDKKFTYLLQSWKPKYLAWEQLTHPDYMRLYYEVTPTEIYDVN